MSKAVQTARAPCSVPAVEGLVAPALDAFTSMSAQPLALHASHAVACAGDSPCRANFGIIDREDTPHLPILLLVPDHLQMAHPKPHAWSGGLSTNHV